MQIAPVCKRLPAFVLGAADRNVRLCFGSLTDSLEKSKDGVKGQLSGLWGRCRLPDERRLSEEQDNT